MVVNILGEFFTREVKINSKRVLNFAKTHRACVVPRSLDLACLILAETTLLRPMLRLMRVFS